MTIALIVAAKFVLPVLIVPFPFAAGWANFVLDGIDGDLLIPLGLPNDVYQPVDKLSDWVTYVAIVVVGYRNQWPIRRLMLGLFVFRSIGQVAFLLTENELFLALFPNFLEPLFLVTATILAWERVVRHHPDWQEEAFALVHRHRWLIGRADRRLQTPGRVLHAHRQHRPQRVSPALRTTLRRLDAGVDPPGRSHPPPAPTVPRSSTTHPVGDRC